MSYILATTAAAISDVDIVMPHESNFSLNFLISLKYVMMFLLVSHSRMYYWILNASFSLVFILMHTFVRICFIICW